MPGCTVQRFWAACSCMGAMYFNMKLYSTTYNHTLLCIAFTLGKGELCPLRLHKNIGIRSSTNRFSMDIWSVAGLMKLFKLFAISVKHHAKSLLTFSQEKNTIGRLCLNHCCHVPRKLGRQIWVV